MTVRARSLARRQTLLQNIGALAPRPGLAYCGDDESAKDTAAELIRDAGFDPVDAGPLRIARYTEPFALVVARLAYGGTESPALAYRFERLG